LGIDPRPDPSIRPATPADAAGCLAIYGPLVKGTPASFETDPPAEPEFAGRIESAVRDHAWLVYDTGAGIDGYAYAVRHRGRAAYRWSVEVSVFVAPGHHRRGVGRALYTRLLDDLRGRGFFNALAVIALPNPASVAFHESMGFKPVGVCPKAGFKLGRWHDVGWWALRLRDGTPQPGPED
jgi:L-amino acid N-acyltransferase YncA